MKRIFSLAAVVLLILALSFTACASRSQQLEVVLSDGTRALSGADVYLYRIGVVDGDEIIPEKEFDSYSIIWKIGDTQTLQNLALTLQGYVLRDDLTAYCHGVTNDGGRTDFDGRYIEQGVYILLADKHCRDGITCFIEPSIVVIPYGEDDKLTVIPKITTVDEATQDISVSYKVLKAWVEDEEGFRPVEIEVELLCDGEVYSSVILDEENNWSYVWQELSVFNHWTVVEKTVPAGYKVMLSMNSKTLLLTNSGEGGTEEPSENPDEGESETNPDDEAGLPVTGSLKWMIPFLVTGGIFLIAVGYVIIRKSEIQNEKG